MKLSTLKKLQTSFEGKICTVLTLATCKGPIGDNQFPDFFTGIIESIDDDGILMRHAISNCLNFFAMAYIVEIIEEQVLYENNPEHAKIINKIKENLPKQNSPINFDLMNDLSKKANKPT